MGREFSAAEMCDTIPHMKTSIRKKMMMAFAAASAVMLGMACAVLMRAQEPEHHPDTQKLIIDNMFVRVYDIHVPPGVFEPMHSHGRGVTVAMSDYDNETKTPEGKVNRGHTKFGEVKWVEPVRHEAKNIGTTEQHVVRIELKYGG